MKRNYITLAAATAIGLAMSASAYAADNNKLFIDQNGTGNEASVHQSKGNNNDIGTSLTPALQNGNGNYFGYTNNKYNGGNNNDIIELKQDGNDNWFNAVDEHGAANNTINDVLQHGNTNQALINRYGDSGSTVDQLIMDGNSNVAYIKQGTYPYGGSNTVTLAKIVGDNNGRPDTRALYEGAYPGRAAINIYQKDGTGNTIDEASIEGSNNNYHTGTDNAVRIYQFGSDNGNGASTARLIGSGGNKIWVTESGNGNNFTVLQGSVTSDTGNSAEVTQTGNDNGITIDQDGSYNSTTANFAGNGNGVGTLSGKAGALASVNTDLTQGTIFQDSSAAISGNSVDYNVTGDSNLFAFAQIGGGNTITGTVGNLGASNGNQVAIIQSGSSNVSTFSQNGGGSNNIAVSQ
jgi:hypothetical protein